ncbi:hypothetical protein BT96DRAFT_939722 [Gymnopus androsaceus JB14]|uniref:Uncharacterized protein n=1 Tax=Gymnopus androsaceus JB14 TaxID=1447944 RepID=A0A6A4HN72_9AGAR|nr:hypothetical protein BT96DRAFT_939722 [Gymnopus androsaceus JB14]
MPPLRHKFIHNTTQNTTQSIPHRRVRFEDHENAPPTNPTTTLDQNARNVMDAAVSDKTRQRKLQYAAEFLVWAADHGLTERGRPSPLREHTLQLRSIVRRETSWRDCESQGVSSEELGPEERSCMGRGETTCGTSSMAKNKPPSPMDFT